MKQVTKRNKRLYTIFGIFLFLSIAFLAITVFTMHQIRTNRFLIFIVPHDKISYLMYTNSAFGLVCCVILFVLCAYSFIAIHYQKTKAIAYLMFFVFMFVLISLSLAIMNLEQSIYIINYYL